MSEGPVVRRKRPRRAACVAVAVACVAAVVAAGGLALTAGGHIALAPAASHGATPRATPSSIPARGGRVAAPAPTSTSAAATRPDPRLASTRTKYLVLFVLDGAQPDYFDVPNTPHIHALMRHGMRYSNAWAGILESETPSGHATIATGSQPRDDGILSFAWANSDNTTVDLFDPAKIRDGQMEGIMGRAPAPSIASLIHQKDRTAKVVALGGHKYYAQDALGGPDADVVLYYTGTPDGRFVPVSVPGHVPPTGILNDGSLSAPKSSLPMGVEDHLSMRLALKTFNRMHPRAMLINLPEFDWPLGHNNGGDLDPAGVKTLMQGFDRDLGSLKAAYRKAGILDKTIFVVTADHGMAPIYHKISNDVLDRAIAQAGTSIISDTYHTASYIWVKDESRAAQAAANIARLRNPYIQAVYFRSPGRHGGYEYIRATGAELFRAKRMEAANQYLLNTFNGPSGPDLVVLFAEDTASLPGGEAVWKGDHGGSGWASQHLPLLIAGPGVRHGVSQLPAPLMDVAPTALSLIGAGHTGMQGVPLADAMLHATSADRRAQDQQARQLEPVIQSLQWESTLELKAGR